MAEKARRPQAASDHEVWNIEAGDPASGVILHVPHASRHIPIAEHERFLIDSSSLEAELDAITDADTDRLARAACRRARRQPWMFFNRNSRLLVDPERFPDDREEMLAVGMGPVYSRTADQQELRSTDPADDERLMNSYYWPYARAFERLVEERLSEVGQVLIIDVHSYPRDSLPYELHADQARPSLCIGTDGYHTPPALARVAMSAWSGSTELNQPFSGCYVPERFYKTDGRVQAVMLEIRRDVIKDWLSEEPTMHDDSAIVSAIAAVIDTDT
ncbi:MAG: N-formylglutamate amidohydrolase [Solirubrobacterales bacterium]|nr:N-formylglutamate amidohydrolase [Solirubrobacterales bacterium]